MLRSFATLLVSLIVVVVASPPLETRQSITILSSAQVASFKPYSFYAAAAYCQPANTLAWNCGENCQANPTFKPVASGGDGNSVQFWYVGYDPTLETVIVGHQGTDVSEIITTLTDPDLLLHPLDSLLFPGVPSTVEVENGFQREQGNTANQVLAAVQHALSTNSANQVTVVGHSLGAALALLDAVYLRTQLPSNTNVKMINYGSPRIGNLAFADYVDSHVQVTHVTNKKDPVPILPGRSLGYAHPNGEIHIKEDNTWALCPGNDNTDKQCIVGDVPTIFDGRSTDHAGPYDGVEMGC